MEDHHRMVVVVDVEEVVSLLDWLYCSPFCCYFCCFRTSGLVLRHLAYTGVDCSITDPFALLLSSE